ncbi:MAG: alginate lyase family protein [Armatimonadota bacterium]|jgi:hypothetical protein
MMLCIAMLLGGAPLAQALPPIPPLPEVERYAMSDEDLMDALDPEHPAAAGVLRIRDEQGMEAAKQALAEHFRARTEPVWFVSQHDELESADLRTADAALGHLIRGHQFGETIDWFENPTTAPGAEFNKEWTMALVRMPWWVDLARAWRATGDERYARELADQFLHFRETHPIPLGRSGWLSSHPLKYAVPEWRTLEMGVRLSSTWINAFYHALGSEAFDAHVICEFLKSFHEMAHHLLQFSTVRDMSNNWLTHETRALYNAGVLFPEFAASGEWKSVAADRMWAELNKQLYPDGAQWELAPSYGAGVLGQFRDVYRLARLNDEPLPDGYLDRLQASYDYYLYSSVNGRAAAFGDSGRSDVRRILRWGVEDFPEREDFRWMATGGEGGERPTALTSEFPWAGQYVMRSGWDPDDRFMIVDAGPYGTGHQHEDKLSFELWAYGEYLITDPGTYTYNYDSPWRHFMVSSLSHNTVAVDHLGQNRRGLQELYITEEPLDNWFAVADGLVSFRGSYEAGYGPERDLRVTHTRTVLFVDGRYWVLIDRMLPEDDAEHLYEALYMLTGEASAVEGVIRTSRDGANLALSGAASGGAIIEVVEGQEEPVKRGWRRGGGSVVPNPTAVVATRASGPAVLATVLYPVPAGEAAPEVGLELVEADAEGKVSVRVTLPDGGEQVLIDEI